MLAMAEQLQQEEKEVFRDLRREELSSDKTGGTGGGGTCPGSAGAFAFFIPNTVSLLSLV